MTVDEFVALLSRVTYKPGWRFMIGPDPTCMNLEGAVGVTAMVEDSYGSGKMVEIGNAISFPPPGVLERFTEEDALDWLFAMLRPLEFHESREWFKVDGHVVRDPHARDRV